MNLCDLGTIKQIMAAHGLTFRKEFGQNFLTRREVVEEIADRCCDDENTTILEIGPGIGVLTQELAMRHRKVIAVEIDRGLIPVLHGTLAEYDNIELHNADVMEVDLPALLAPAFAEGPVAVCANLPYYITTPILMKLLESGLPFSTITVMVQAEVAQRLCAKAGSGDYGAITAVLAYYGRAERLFTVPAGYFVPPPKVNSAVVRIDLWQDRPCKPIDEALFFRVIKGAFEQRRKTLVNALSSAFPEFSKEELAEEIVAAGHRADIRGEKLDVAAFSDLADRLAARKENK
ncbi:MAG: 16S rRNA (adenine(1518)-N(6)/adenine(1519)-N(6))-dimethyltransferase RsmA [Clostridia bacterium]|nr:16S rRNA (adenine(1518)-N(6)/adenine(1519)-N(6))-dimethyltransferase RsmA [Clostridia bacterium]